LDLAVQDLANVLASKIAKHGLPDIFLKSTPVVMRSDGEVIQITLLVHATRTGPAPKEKSKEEFA
jgi:hypothetical protein